MWDEIFGESVFWGKLGVKFFWGEWIFYLTGKSIWFRFISSYQKWTRFRFTYRMGFCPSLKKFQMSHGYESWLWVTNASWVIGMKSMLTQFRRWSFFFWSSLDEPEVPEVWDEIEVREPHDRTLFKFCTGDMTSPSVTVTPVVDTDDVTFLSVISSVFWSSGVVERNFESCCSKTATTVC